MVITDFDSNFIYLQATAVEAAYVGATYMRSKKQYRIPISLAAIEDLEQHTSIAKVYPLKQKLVAYDKWVSEVKTSTTTTIDTRLRPYQAADVAFLRGRANAAVFNEQRTGKTPTTLIAVKDIMKKGVIVCPAGLKLNWKAEILHWLNRSATVVKGSPAARIGLYNDFYSKDDGILILSYETLRSDSEKITKIIKSYDVLIVDEAHRLRNYKTKQSKALFDFSKHAKHIYPLTGTPAVNHPSDVFGIMHLLNPKKYTSYWQFVERYFGYSEGQFGRTLYGLRKDKERELTQILNHISVQRKRADVMSWIPKVQRRTIELEFDTKQKSQYKKALKEFQYGEQTVEDIPNVLAQLTRLRQICVDPQMLGIDAVSPKTQFIKEFIDDSDGKIIIFSSFTSYLKQLHLLIPDSVLLTGEQTQKEKQEAVDAIQRGTGRVLLANIRAGGVGFTLDRADTIIFTDRSYNPVDNDQAADRFIPTQEDAEYGTKEIIDLVMENSLEKRINKILETKQDIISYVNDYIKRGSVLFGEIE